MILSELYSSTLRFTDMTQARFITFYKMTVSELVSEYGDGFVIKKHGDSEKSYSERMPENIHCENICFDEYDNTIINNILYLDDNDKAECRNKSLSQRHEAYLSVWRKKAPSKAKAREW